MPWDKLKLRKCLITPIRSTDHKPSVDLDQLRPYKYL